ncbi:MAG TPA: pentapeptide repeat-containing protein [Candidatus Acidoferrum sp.]
MQKKVQGWTVVLVLLFLLVPGPASGQAGWTWTDGTGAIRTRAELERILEDHKLWLSSDGTAGKRANLTGVNLKDADLTEVNLSNGQLTGAGLERVNLAGAELFNAGLEGARLNDAALVKADLTSAHLNGVDLRGARLDGTDFDSADLQGVRYEPASGTENGLIATARNLELMTYLVDSTELSKLRKQFQDGGFREQERRIVYAMNRREAELAGPVERWFKTVAFEWTCKYGMIPGRTLQIWVALLCICWLVYAALMHIPGESGIYRISKQGESGHEVTVEVQIKPRTVSSGPWWRSALQIVWREWQVLFWALFFSLMSAFNIGFRDINFGRWLRLLPRSEYDLKAKGWARTVAGLQSLFSVYLIALWVLTYFGRPFE